MKEVMLQRAKLGFILYNFMVIAVFGMQNIETFKLDTLPVGIKIDSGRIVSALKFIDKNGENIFVAVEYEQSEYGKPDYKAQIYARQYIKKEHDWKMLWKIWDFAPHALSSVGFKMNTFKVFDFDGDSIAETSFFYTIAFEGADPRHVKYMLHFHGEKFAIRGKFPMSIDDVNLYEKNMDPAYKKLDEKLRDYASNAWDAYAKKYFIEEFDLKVLPVPKNK